MADANDKHVFLIGFSGSGKSTVGPMLAKRLSRTFIDTDDVIERQARKSIYNIFADNGEAWFRTREREVIFKSAHRRQPLVVALGGGAVKNAEIRKLLKRTGVIVYLSCDVRELSRRLSGVDDRPLLSGPSGRRSISAVDRTNRIKTLLEKRRRWYEQADIRVPASHHTPREVVTHIVRKLRDKHGIDRG